MKITLTLLLSTALVCAGSWTSCTADAGTGSRLEHSFGEVIYLAPGAKLRHKAEQGDPNAQFQLANLYYSGSSDLRLGIGQNYKKAFQLYEQAAFANHVGAQHNLAYMYHLGEGVEADNILAYAWFYIASQNSTSHNRNSCRLASEALGELKLDMGKEDIARAKKVAQQLQEQIR